MDVCLRVLKESSKSRFDSLSVRNSVLIKYPILPFGIVTCTFFPTIILEIAVYRYAQASTSFHCLCSLD